MPDLGQSKIEKILRAHYQEGLGGTEVWSAVDSIKIYGSIEVDGEALRLHSFQKKPDRVKLSVRHADSQGEAVLAYDGAHAWQQLGRHGIPELMEAEEGRRFAHGACFRNYLLYPFRSGKAIRYIDTVPIEGNICHQIRVELDSGYQIDYFIDIRTHLEVKIQNKDLKSGRQSSIVYRDYVETDLGLPVAKTIESYEDGALKSVLTIEEIKFNAGVMPWMFEMPK